MFKEIGTLDIGVTLGAGRVHRSVQNRPSPRLVRIVAIGTGNGVLGKSMTLIEGELHEHVFVTARANRGAGYQLVEARWQRGLWLVVIVHRVAAYAGHTCPCMQASAARMRVLVTGPARRILRFCRLIVERQNIVGGGPAHVRAAVAVALRTIASGRLVRRSGQGGVCASVANQTVGCVCYSHTARQNQKDDPASHG